MGSLILNCLILNCSILSRPNSTARYRADHPRPQRASGLCHPGRCRWMNDPQRKSRRPMTRTECVKQAVCFLVLGWGGLGNCSRCPRLIQTKVSGVRVRVALSLEYLVLRRQEGWRMQALAVSRHRRGWAKTGACCQTYQWIAQVGWASRNAGMGCWGCRCQGQAAHPAVDYFQMRRNAVNLAQAAHCRSEGYSVRD